MPGHERGGHSVVVTPVGSHADFDRWLAQATVRGTNGALSVLHLPRGEELHRQPLAAMAATAFRMLRASGTDPAAQAHHMELATTLVVRDSTAPPPG